jgi:hypothetical protein
LILTACAAPDGAAALALALLAGMPFERHRPRLALARTREHLLRLREEGRDLVQTVLDARVGNAVDAVFDAVFSHGLYLRRHQVHAITLDELGLKVRGTHWWNQYTRVQFNWIHTMLDNNARGFSAMDIFATRFQVEF